MSGPRQPSRRSAAPPAPARGLPAGALLSAVLVGLALGAGALVSRTTPAVEPPPPPARTWASLADYTVLAKRVEPRGQMLVFDVDVVLAGASTPLRLFGPDGGACFDAAHVGDVLPPTVRSLGLSHRCRAETVE